MEQAPGPISPSVSPEPKDGHRAPANIQLPTPNSSPPSSPKPTSSAKAWLLSVSATTEQLSQPTSSQPSLPSTSAPPTPENPSFTNDFFEVRSSPKKGLGAFAVTDIPKGTVIMVEEPLFRAEPVQIYWKYEALSDDQKRAYKVLSCWFGIEDHKVPAIFTTNRFVQLRMSQDVWEIY
jgi:hypothetical protein